MLLLMQSGDERDQTPQSVTKNDTPSNTARTDGQKIQNGVFVTMALTMSWQLALVVIVPIVGGHVLDTHYHTDPWLTVGGFVVAVIGVLGVLSKSVADANRRFGNQSGGGA